MKNNNLLLTIAGLLILLGLLKPDLSNIIGGPSRPSVVDVLELSAPTDETIKAKADDVVRVIKANNINKGDCKRLRDLYIDLSRLVELDGENEVVKNTEDIRQANSLAGPMLRLDIKGKYPDLAKAAKEVIVSSIGDDQILLSKELRAKAADGFNALAWAFNQGSK